MIKNKIGQTVDFQMNLRADGTDGTGLSPSVTVKIDGGPVAAGGGTVIETSLGGYEYGATQAETNGNHVVFAMNEATSITQRVNVYPLDPAVIELIGTGYTRTAQSGDFIQETVSVT